MSRPRGNVPRAKSDAARAIARYCDHVAQQRPLLLAALQNFGAQASAPSAD
jgi:hypothetical protein